MSQNRDFWGDRTQPVLINTAPHSHTHTEGAVTAIPAAKRLPSPLVCGGRGALTRAARSRVGRGMQTMPPMSRLRPALGARAGRGGRWRRAPRALRDAPPFAAAAEPLRDGASGWGGRETGCRAARGGEVGSEG